MVHHKIAMRTCIDLMPIVIAEMIDVDFLGT